MANTRAAFFPDRQEKYAAHPEMSNASTDIHTVGSVKRLSSGIGAFQI